MSGPEQRIRFVPVKNAVQAEAMLRQLAELPAPEGLEDRVKHALRGHALRGQVLKGAPQIGGAFFWPENGLVKPGWRRGPALRALAAAAIVLIVVGGGWSVATLGPREEAVPRIALPHVHAPGGFSSAGAMRTPQTLNPPVIQRGTHAKEKRTAEKAKEAAAPANPKQKKPKAHGRIAGEKSR
ncbi:MAG TPA: hypothetical protein VMV57_14045 [Terracidiphilus sp.]|nr:hypothetical protein [Terracidiphilus sp.]